MFYYKSLESSFLRKVLFLLCLFTGLNLYSSEYMQCNFNKQLGSEITTKLSSIREQTANTCLICEGQVCSMKIWPKKEKGNSMVCERLFCTPEKIRKVVGEEIPTDLRPGKSKIEFTYKITEKGKVKDVMITSVKGVMNERDAYRWVTGVTRRTVFLPLVIKGKTYEINNLSATMTANLGAYDAGN